VENLLLIHSFSLYCLGFRVLTWRYLKGLIVLAGKFIIDSFFHCIVQGLGFLITWPYLKGLTVLVLAGKFIIDSFFHCIVLFR